MKFIVKKDIVIKKGTVLELAPEEFNFMEPYEYIVGIGKKGQGEIIFDIDTLMNEKDYFEIIEEENV